MVWQEITHVAYFPKPDDWRVFHGEASPAAARLYVHWQIAEPEAFDRLRVEVTGPYCRYARTLPSTTRAEARIAGGAALARLAIVDPCFWTPELPFLYRARVTVEQGGVALWSDERACGIRRFGVRGERFYFEAKNWVLRGGAAIPAADFDWDAWRMQDLVAVVNEPDEAFCTAADQLGLLVAARVSTGDRDVLALLRRWERHPAVALAILPGRLALDTGNDVPPGRPVLVAELTNAEAPPEWADAVVGDWTCAPHLAGVSRPALVSRASGSSWEPAIVRAACDTLQSELATRWQLAGYISS